MEVPRLGKGQKLRVALIGVLADQKGAPAVAGVVEAADPGAFDFRLIGHPEHEPHPAVRRRVRIGGEYQEKIFRRCWPRPTRTWCGSRRSGRRPTATP